MAINNAAVARDAITWARHEGASVFCAVASSEPGHSTITLCNGRWPSEDHVEKRSRPLHADRCEECQRALVERRLVEIGLAELRNAPAVNFAFDMTDADQENADDR